MNMFEMAEELALISEDLDRLDHPSEAKRINAISKELARRRSYATAEKRAAGLLPLQGGPTNAS